MSNRFSFLKLRLRRGWMIISLANNAKEMCWKKPFCILNKVGTILIRGEMKCHMVPGSLPIRALGTAPWNASVAGALRMLAQTTQSVNGSEIITVDCDAEVIELMLRHAVTP